jgi:predicted RNA-binding Zn-ribbon protein involved in translation (DUF1610 family)
MTSSVSTVKVLRPGKKPFVYYHQACSRCDALLEVMETESQFQCPECKMQLTLIKDEKKSVVKYLETYPADKKEDQAGKEDQAKVGKEEKRGDKKVEGKEEKEGKEGKEEKKREDVNCHSCQTPLAGPTELVSKMCHPCTTKKCDQCGKFQMTKTVAPAGGFCSDINRTWMQVTKKCGSCCHIDSFLIAN